MITRPLLFALLYAALGLCAIPVAADPLSEAEQATIEALREDQMRKLVLANGADMSGVAYQDESGGNLRIGDSNGRVRLINYWATWCAPCRAEKPTLDRLQSTLKGPDFEVIAIATGRNRPDSIKRFNAENGITRLATFLDADSSAARSMGVFGLPVTVLLDRDGQELGRLSGGADWDTPSARAILDMLIAR